MEVMKFIEYCAQSISEKVVSSPLDRSTKKSVLFCRNYRSFTGGQLKVRDYFEHVFSSEKYEPWIYMTRKSDPSIEGLWNQRQDRIIKNYEYKKADLIFLAGPDWKFLSEKYRRTIDIPKINLIQDFWATDPNHQLNQFLRYPAIRICVSEQLRQAILDTGNVNGPVTVIPNGIDTSEIREFKGTNNKKAITIFGQKNPKMAEDLAHELSCYVPEINVISKRISRRHILDSYSSTNIAVLLPYETEGFYLPAIEAMASGCVVIVPDCVGNRSFCIDHKNCIIPKYTLHDMKSAILRTANSPKNTLNELRESARITAREYSISNERDSFNKLLLNIDKIWNSNFKEI